MTHDEALSLLAEKIEKLEDVLEIIKTYVKPIVFKVKDTAYISFEVKGTKFYYAVPIEKYNLLEEWLDNEKIKKH